MASATGSSTRTSLTEGNTTNDTSLVPRYPGSWSSWKPFLGSRVAYSVTRLLPSHAWRDDLVIASRQARSLNLTLKSLRLDGLAFLNVHISVEPRASAGSDARHSRHGEPRHVSRAGRFLRRARRCHGGAATAFLAVGPAGYSA
ncbi:hypothetical protein MRX96_005505 [Rhipicephalus microplus]